MINTVAGMTHLIGDGGPANSAVLFGPNGVVLDRSGQLYIADTGNHVIRRVTSDGVISPIAGTGVEGFSGDGGPATEARLALPTNVVLDETGDLYIADARNDRIRVLAAVPLISPNGIVNSASFLGGPFAPDSIISLFGLNLAASTAQAAVTPLPTSLRGTTVTVTDNAGIERPASLFFVSGAQINCLIPPATAIGPAMVTVTRVNGRSSTATIQIEAFAPGVFAVQGIAAALLLRVGADGSQSSELVFAFDAEQGRFISVPIDIGPETDQVFLLLFGTGIRGRSALSAVKATVGGEDVRVPFAGPQGGFVGLDQINVGPLPQSLIGRGEIGVVLTVDGKRANTVTVNVL